MLSHSEYAAVQAIRLRGHVALRHVGGMFGKERFRRPLGEPRSRPPRRHAHGSGRYVLTPYRSCTTNPHLFLANQNRVNHPTRRSTSDTEAIALPERPARPRGKRNFQVRSTRKYRPDRCARARLWSGPGHRVCRVVVWSDRVFNGRVPVTVSRHSPRRRYPRRILPILRKTRNYLGGACTAVGYPG